jgi:hypothetical protein
VTHGDDEVEWTGWEKAIGLMLLPLLVMVEGMLVSKLWSWFVVPLGAPSITTATGAGLGLVCILLAGRASATPPKTTLVVMVTNFFLKILFFWGFGALFHFCGSGLP